MTDKIDLLVEILFDITAREDERHDAVMDIGEFDDNDNRALQALLQIAQDPKENNTILDACGESIAQIWAARNKFDIEIYQNFQSSAQNSVKSYFEIKKPEWVQFF